MRTVSKFLTLAAGLGVLAAMVPTSAQAQDYPNKVITMVVPYAPGGPGDTAGRAIIDKMSQVLGQQIIIENVAGAGGMTGAARVARAAPDGYTILMHQTGLAMGPALYSKLAFDPIKDFAPIGLVNTSHSFLSARADLPANNLKELIAWAKSSGKPVKFAHPGVGTLAHLQSVMLIKALGIEADLVPYRGGGLAMNDVIAGHVDMVWAAPATSAELIKSKKIKGLTFGAAKPYFDIPEIDDVAKLGYPDIAIPFWHALYAPAATPPAVIEKLNAALRAALDDPKVLETYKQRGLEAFPADQRSPEAAAKYMRSEVELWAKVVKDNNIQAQ